MKEEIKNSKNSVECTIQKQWKCIVQIVRNIQQTKILVSEELN